ncbi:MAG: GNAT family N-acetyltransferase [Desulfobacterales bacterium]|nr:GNAT family N-acetyltransferase [Desulfobacterales bacterium]
MTDMLVKLYALPDRVQRPPGSLVVRRALASERTAVAAWVHRTFGAGWAAECEITFSRLPVSCFIAHEAEALTGFCVYDATARGMLGPIGVAPAYQRQGLGRALLLAALEAMHAIGYAYAVVGWVQSEHFFRRTVGAMPIPGSDPGLYAGLLPPPPD